MLMENATVSTLAGAAVDATPTGPLDWEAKKEKILSLYLDHSVKQVKEIMERDYGFSAR
jgi:hypothetical protein